MHLRREGETAKNQAKVKTITLDTFDSYRSYALGKMDIEGAEPMALAGAAGRLRDATPPVWLLELAGYSTCYGVSSDEVIRQLADAQFDCAVYRPETGSLEYTATPWLLGVQNVLAISRKHRAMVEARIAQRTGQHS
jgi:hypothetical protein